MGLARPAHTWLQVRGRAKPLVFGVGVSVASTLPVTPTRNASDLARSRAGCERDVGRSKSVAFHPPPSRRLRRLGGGDARCSFPAFSNSALIIAAVAFFVRHSGAGTPTQYGSETRGKGGRR